MAACVITGHLIAALRGTAEFQSGNHALFVGEGGDAIYQRHAESTVTALRVDRAAASIYGACWMVWITRTWVCLSVIPSTVNGMELGAQEWISSLFLS